MGVMMGSISALSFQFRYAMRNLFVRQVPILVAGCAMAFAIGVTAVDQWVTTSITPFLMCSLAVSLVFYLRPMAAARLYLASCVAFYVAIGWYQDNPQVLLSNRLNGMVAGLLGLALSVILWRNFTTIQMQQDQLDRANSELQIKQRDLERLTRLDGLTGLFNRRTFVELSRQELMRGQRQGSATAILLFDLDHFKRINDTWGHPAGDAVLRNVATVAARAVRGTDLLGRLGGEEFIVLLPSTSIEAARKLAEKIRAHLQANPAAWEGHSIAATASIGVAGTTAAQKRDFDSLYHEADKALYLAKTRGRNRVES
jgi:diguanylate cyclase (GGDEF)-like protein